MAWRLGVLLSAAMLIAAAAASAPSVKVAEGPMGWAYPAAPKDRPELGSPGHRQKTWTITGSRLSLTTTELDDPWSAVDWLPAEHPLAPPVVLHGRKPDVYACGLCHMVNGEGTRGVPGLAGLAKNYIVAQVTAFARGQRSSTFLLRDAQNMIHVARYAHDDEMVSAADYFSRLSFRPVIRVVEQARVPATAPSYWGWIDALAGPANEPIGHRIVEVANDTVRAALSDPHAGYVAYVPPGSIARGRALALRGVGGQPSCAACHGPGLKGSDEAPPLAGRSPTYLARQLWDIRTGARHNPSSAPMKPIAGALDADGIIDLTAYLASLKP